MAKSGVYEQIEALNAECEEFCLDRSNWANTKWQGVGPKGTANFRLLYSAPETFGTPGRVMILGTNPGGSHANADQLDPREPFRRGADYSAYLDDRWPKPRSAILTTAGRHPIQSAVRRLAATLSGGSPEAGDQLLRRSPSGNLIPFRSQGFPDLPRSLHRPGLDFGARLIDIARPRVIVLLASNKVLWEWLMSGIGHAPEPDFERDMGANFTFREARTPENDWPKLVFALPGFNASTEGQNRKALHIFRGRLADLGLTRR